MKQVPVIISLESSLFRVTKQTKWVRSNGEQRRIYHMVNFMTLRKAKCWRTVVVFWSIIINFTRVLFFLILSIDQTLGVYVYPPPLLTQLGQYVYPFIFTLQISPSYLTFFLYCLLPELSLFISDFFLDWTIWALSSILRVDTCTTNIGPLLHVFHPGTWWHNAAPLFKIKSF